MSDATSLACAAWGLNQLGELELRDLRNWRRLHDRLGSDVPDAMARALIETIRAKTGDEGLYTLVRTRWGPPGLRGVAGMLPEVLDPLEAQLERLTGLTLPDLVAAWQQRLADLPPHIREAVAAIEVPSAAVEVREQGAERTLAVTLPLGVETTFQYANAGAYDRLPPEGSIRTMLTTLKGEAVELDESWPQHTRIAWRAHRWSPQLQCHLVSPWTREVLR